MELLLIGSVGFWMLVLAEIIILAFLLEYDRGLAATGSFVAFCFIVGMFGGVDIIGVVKENPYLIGSLLFSYLGIGIVWATFKWRMYCVGRVDLYNELKAKHFPDGITENNRRHWIDVLDRHHGSHGYKDTPLYQKALIRNNKSRWVKWAAAWPIGMVMFLIKDMVLGCWNQAYKLIANSLQKISDSVYLRSGVSNDFPEGEMDD